MFIVWEIRYVSKSLQVNISDVSIDFIMAGENNGVREHIRQQLLAKQKQPKIVTKVSVLLSMGNQ